MEEDRHVWVPPSGGSLARRGFVVHSYFVRNGCSVHRHLESSEPRILETRARSRSIQGPKTVASTSCVVVGRPRSELNQGRTDTFFCIRLTLLRTRAVTKKIKKGGIQTHRAVLGRRDSRARRCLILLKATCLAQPASCSWGLFWPTGFLGRPARSSARRRERRRRTAMPRRFRRGRQRYSGPFPVPSRRERRTAAAHSIGSRRCALVLLRC